MKKNMLEFVEKCSLLQKRLTCGRTEKAARHMDIAYGVYRYYDEMFLRQNGEIDSECRN